VEFETAGGNATEATLDAVSPAEADRLRRLVKQHDREAESAGRPADDRAVDEAAETDGATADEHTEAQIVDDTEDEQELLFAFTLRELLTYAVVSVRPAAPVLTLVSLPLGIDIVRSVVRFNLTVVGGSADTVGLASILTGLEMSQLTVLAALTAAEFLLTALLVSVALTVVEYYGFQLTRDGEDLRYQRGLLRRYS